jgi:RNA-directed DNA polymerase
VRKRQQQRGSAKATISRLVSTYLLDVWFEAEVKPRLRGKAFEIRYADDGLLCFQFKEDAERVLEVLPKTFAKYGLTKTATFD